MTQYKEREETQAIDALVLSFMHAISSSFVAQTLKLWQ